MKVVFMGTPQFAVNSLIEVSKRHEIVAVVCQPDKLGNRNKLVQCEVKKYALEHNLPLYQFNKVSREGLDILANLHPDVMVTAAFGQILSRKLLEVAPHGVINVHASMLPKLRGAAPINWAIINGDKTTGVTIMRTVYELDAGDILLQQSLEIDKDENAEQLTERLSLLGSELLVKALDMIESGTAVYTSQDESQVTFCGKVKSDTEAIDWTKSNVEIHNLVRALAPTPASFTTLFGKRLKVYQTQVVEQTSQDNLRNSNEQSESTAVKCGTLELTDKNGITVKTGVGSLVIKQLQYEGGKILYARDFLNGKKIPIGTVLGE